MPFWQFKVEMRESDHLTSCSCQARRVPPAPLLVAETEYPGWEGTFRGQADESEWV